jgi:hypothetical protein
MRDPQARALIHTLNVALGTRDFVKIHPNVERAKTQVDQNRFSVGGAVLISASGLD